MTKSVIERVPIKRGEIKRAKNAIDAYLAKRGLWFKKRKPK
jgi:hypothetical protein